MAVIDILIQPRGRTRVLFDCRTTKPRPDDEMNIERAIARAIETAVTEAPAVSPTLRPRPTAAPAGR